MSAARIDFALVQPLVYSLETWLDVRHGLADLVEEGGETRLGLPGARLHLVGEEAPLFTRGLNATDGLPAAFPALLAQARDFPCIHMPVAEPSTALLAAGEEWPPGLVLESAETHFLLPPSGDLILLHLASGMVDPKALTDPERAFQRELRSLYQALVERTGDRLCSSLEDIVERVTRGAPSERVADALEASGGHLVTLAGSTDPDLVAGLARVHAIQEGSAENQRNVLLPGDPSEDCFARFGWAYTTVATPNRALSYRLLFPLIGVNQAWYRYAELRGDVIELSKVINRLETDRDLIAQTGFYNQVVLDVKVWEAEREAFERGLRPVYRSVYDRLWDYWDTDESKATVHEGIDYLRDFLDRKYNVKIALRETTQSKILFVIAIFQLLSVFGLVSGYLYFWENTRLPEAALFDSDLMVWATIVSPVVVMVGIVWLLVSFFRRHR